ncbi:hypothetical protein CRUP_013443 [Coryphaenoides rupestris]|nr:hypothetical protein CRUP_013443 [Coryphaenoides rupestris]
MLCLQDVDECSEDVTICGPEAICNNTIGAYFCTCNPDFNSKSPKPVSSDGDADTGGVVLGISERLVASLSENQTEMNSDIISAFLPKTKHSNFSQPVNFTIQHKKILMSVWKTPVVLMEIV